MSTSPKSDGSGYAKVSVGADSTCAIKNDDTLWCWGNNVYGQLGDGSGTPSSSPVQIFSSVRTVDVGARSACLITNSNNLYCWGRNSSGQLGDGTTSDRVSPMPIAGSSWSTVSVGAEVTCAIDSSSVLYCAGRNDASQLGTGSTTPAYISNFNLVGAGYLKVEVGSNEKGNAPGTHVCALSGTALECWGTSALGQNAPANIIYSPTAVDASSYSSFAVGELQTCAKTTGGIFKCRGAGEESQIPLGVTNTLPNLLPRIRF
jgi:hypothetical protein